MGKMKLYRALAAACAAAFLLAACGLAETPGPGEPEKSLSSAVSREISSRAVSRTPSSSAPESSEPASSEPQPSDTTSVPAPSGASTSSKTVSKPASSQPPVSSKAEPAPSSAPAAPKAPASSQASSAPAEPAAEEEKPIHISVKETEFSIAEGVPFDLNLELDPPDAQVTVGGLPDGVRVEGSGAKYTVTIDYFPTQDFTIKFTAKKENYFTAHCSLTIVVPGSSGGEAAGDPAAMADEVFRLTNEQRTANGLGALKRMSELDTGAAIRAEECATSFSHTRPDGTSCYTVFYSTLGENHGYGENIAYGYTTAAAVMEGWMNSPGHRANILEPKYTAIGIGVYPASSGGWYWAQEFYYD